MEGYPWKFWGQVVSKDKPFLFAPEQCNVVLEVNQATLICDSLTGPRHHLYCEIEDKHYHLCSFIPGKIEHSLLSGSFHNDVRFYVTGGNSEINIVGRTMLIEEEENPWGGLPTQDDSADDIDDETSRNTLINSMNGIPIAKHTLDMMVESQKAAKRMRMAAEDEYSQNVEPMNLGMMMTKHINDLEGNEDDDEEDSDFELGNEDEDDALDYYNSEEEDEDEGEGEEDEEGEEEEGEGEGEEEGDEDEEEEEEVVVGEEENKSAECTSPTNIVGDSFPLPTTPKTSPKKKLKQSPSSSHKKAVRCQGDDEAEGEWGPPIPESLAAVSTPTHDQPEQKSNTPSPTRPNENHNVTPIKTPNQNQAGTPRPHIMVTPVSKPSSGPKSPGSTKVSSGKKAPVFGKLELGAMSPKAKTTPIKK